VCSDARPKLARVSPRNHRAGRARDHGTERYTSASATREPKPCLVPFSRTTSCYPALPCATLRHTEQPPPHLGATLCNPASHCSISPHPGATLRYPALPCTTLRYPTLPCATLRYPAAHLTPDSPQSELCVKKTMLLIECQVKFLYYKLCCW
jgi:hypothetical protein